MGLPPKDIWGLNKTDTQQGRVVGDLIMVGSLIIVLSVVVLLFFFQISYLLQAEQYF